MTQKIHKRQYLRYMKTFVWAINHTKEEIEKAVIIGKIEDYPVDATTVEDAINFVETGECLRETKIGMTDLYAIKESLDGEHIKRNTEPQRED
jgi:hypothetical protein